MLLAADRSSTPKLSGIQPMRGLMAPPNWESQYASSADCLNGPASQNMSVRPLLVNQMELGTNCRQAHARSRA
jgi:hypothetical protein